jgi:hypothetical protein
MCHGIPLSGLQMADERTHRSTLALTRFTTSTMLESDSAGRMSALMPGRRNVSTSKQIPSLEQYFARYRSNVLQIAHNVAANAQIKDLADAFAA